MVDEEVLSNSIKAPMIMREPKSISCFIKANMTCHTKITKPGEMIRIVQGLVNGSILPRDRGCLSTQVRLHRGGQRSK